MVYVHAIIMRFKDKHCKIENGVDRYNQAAGNNICILSVSVNLVRRIITALTSL